MDKKITAIKAIRKYCVEQCCCDDRDYVRDCPSNGTKRATDCPLWSFRMGKNPNITEETKNKKRDLAMKNNLGGKTKNKV